MSTPRSNSHAQRNRRDAKHRNSKSKKDNLEVKTSKALSWALRHAAPELGLDMGPDGYVPLDQILSHSHPKFRGITLETIQSIVLSNDKQRFSLTEREGKWYVRANQGHSIKTIDPLQLLRPIPADELSTLSVIVHGTYMDPWSKHIQTEGLSKMNRTHIHFAKGLPHDSEVISGMRQSCTVYVFINAAKCAEDGIEFFESANGVILTAGVQNEGILPPSYFSHVIKKGGEVLLDQR